MKKYFFPSLLATVITATILFVPIDAQTPNPVIISTNALTGACPPRRFNFAISASSAKFCDPSTNTWAAFQTGAPSIPPKLFSQTSLVSLTGTTTATTLLGTGVGSLTLPANQFLNAGDIVHILWYGTYSSGASATTSTYSLLLGASTVAQGTLTGTTTANTSPCSMDVLFTAQTVGVGGTVIADGTMTCGGTTSGAAGVVFGLGNVATAVTINTTTTQVFDFKVAPGNAAMVHKTTNFLLTAY